MDIKDLKSLRTNYNTLKSAIDMNDEDDYNRLLEINTVFAKFNENSEPSVLNFYNKLLELEASLTKENTKYLDDFNEYIRETKPILAKELKQKFNLTDEHLIYEKTSSRLEALKGNQAAISKKNEEAAERRQREIKEAKEKERIAMQQYLITQKEHEILIKKMESLGAALHKKDIEDKENTKEEPDIDPTEKQYDILKNRTIDHQVTANTFVQQISSINTKLLQTKEALSLNAMIERNIKISAVEDFGKYNATQIEARIALANTLLKSFQEGYKKAQAITEAKANAEKIEQETIKEQRALEEELEKQLAGKQREALEKEQNLEKRTKEQKEQEEESDEMQTIMVNGVELDDFLQDLIPGTVFENDTYLKSDKYDQNEKNMIKTTQDLLMASNHTENSHAKLYVQLYDIKQKALTQGNKKERIHNPNAQKNEFFEIATTIDNMMTKIRKNQNLKTSVIFHEGAKQQLKQTRESMKNAYNNLTFKKKVSAIKEKLPSNPFSRKKKK